MRSVGERRGRAILAAASALALGAAGCGNWSNEDIAFVEALPTSSALRVALPQPAGQALCGPPGASDIWAFAKPTGDGFNAGVDALLTLVDLVKQATPTTRRSDARVWGPFPDGSHPGNEIRVTMTRSQDAAGDITYSYAFEVRPTGGEFLPAGVIIDGTFTGGSAKNGRGSLTIHFDRSWALGMAKPTDPTSPMTVEYDRTGDPRTLSLDLTAGSGFGLASFDYGYAGYASGKGLFHYKLTFDAGDYVVDAWFDATGAGIAFVQADLNALPNQTFAFDECWDSAGCVTNVDDTPTLFLPTGVSKLCTGGVCPKGPCPAGLPVTP